MSFAAGRLTAVASHPPLGQTAVPGKVPTAQACGEDMTGPWQAWSPEHAAFLVAPHSRLGAGPASPSCLAGVRASAPCTQRDASTSETSLAFSDLFVNERPQALGIAMHVNPCKISAPQSWLKLGPFFRLWSEAFGCCCRFARGASEKWSRAPPLARKCGPEASHSLNTVEIFLAPFVILS